MDGEAKVHAPNVMDNESGIDMNFDFIDFDYSVFENDSNIDSLLDKACNDVMFYELKSKTVPEETETYVESATLRSGFSFFFFLFYNLKYFKMCRLWRDSVQKKFEINWQQWRKKRERKKKPKQLKNRHFSPYKKNGEYIVVAMNFFVSCHSLRWAKIVAVDKVIIKLKCWYLEVLFHTANIMSSLEQTIVLVSWV